MKQVQRAISAIDLGKMIRSAERKHISPASIYRLLKLYLGTDTVKLMSEWGVYMQCNFNKLSVLLKSHTSSDLIYDVIRSGWFVMGKVPPGETSHYSINWFASPLFVDEAALKIEMENPENPAEPIEKLTYSIMQGDLFGTANLHCKNAALNCIVNYTGINNIILSGRTIPAESIGALESAGTGEEMETKKRKKEKNLSESERIEIVDKFIEELRQSQMHRQQLMAIIKSLTDPSGEGKGPKREAFSPSEAKEILQIFMYDMVRPYFVDSERFFQIDSFAGRVSWFTNLTNGKSGKAMLREAIKKFRAKRTYQERKAQKEAVKNVRSNRPISEYEWMQDDKRYYEDSMEGILQLPADAPPRPSDTAHWNKFTKVWFNL